jgi:hypothetical protein
MPQTLTPELLEADFADMATDFPCTVTFTEEMGGVAQTLPATYGVMDESSLLADTGFLAAYRVSVWCTSSRWNPKPQPGRLVTVNTTNPKTGAVTSVSHQVLLIGQDDGVIMRMLLGDPNA